MALFDFFNRNKKNLNKPNKSPDNKTPAQPTAFGDEEFSTEFYAQEYGTTNVHPFREKDTQLYNDVQLTNQMNTIRLTYSGLLAKSGADEIYALIGYGNNLKWESITEHHMHRVGDQTFELIFAVESPQNINIAFKDSADHWDNNSGTNYTFSNPIEKGSH